MRMHKRTADNVCFMLARGVVGGDWGRCGGGGGVTLHESLRQLELKEIFDEIAVSNLMKYWNAQIINTGFDFNDRSMEKRVRPCSSRFFERS